MDPTRSIVISGMPAVGKTTVAKTISERYGIRYFSGGDVLKDIADELGFEVSEEEWWDSEGGMAFLEMRKKDGSFDKRVDQKLVSLIAEETVVITSYPLPWLTKSPLRIWLKASESRRAERLAGRDNLSLKESIKVVKKRDDENRKIYETLYGIKYGDDLSVFDFVIGTDELASPKVIEIALLIVKCFV